MDKRIDHLNTACYKLSEHRVNIKDCLFLLGIWQLIFFNLKSTKENNNFPHSNMSGPAFIPSAAAAFFPLGSTGVLHYCV